MRDSKGLSVLLALHAQSRSGCCAIREIDRVVVFGRTEIRQRSCFIADRIRYSGEFSVAACCFLELDLIGHGFLTIIGSDLDGRRFLVQIARRDDNLLAGERASGEIDVSFDIRDRTGSTFSFDRGNSSSGLTQGVVLYLGRVRVKTFPLHSVDQEFLDVRRIDQFHIIHIERVTGVHTGRNTEVRILGSREDDVHFLRRGVIQIINRYANVRPVAVRFFLTPDTLSDLIRFLDRSTVVGIDRLADIGFFVGVRIDGRTVTVLTFIGITRTGAGPCVIEHDEVFFVCIRSGTFDPHGHRVRAIGKSDTIICSGSSFVNLRHRSQIDPGVTEGKIPRRGLGDTHGTDVLLLHHHTTTAVPSRLFVSKVELKSDLGYV